MLMGQDDAAARCPQEVRGNMRTTLDIERKLLDSVVAATGEKSKGKAVNAALKEYIRRKHVQELIDSTGARS